MKKRGFTLIEMLIVIVIIGILAGALIPRIGNARDKAEDVATQASVNSITTTALQAIIDGETPCGTDDVIDYTKMTDYGMSDLGTDFKCRQVAGDHVVVYTVTGLNVTSNNNCAYSTIDTFSATTAIADALGVVKKSGDTYDVYCLAQ